MQILRANRRRAMLYWGATQGWPELLPPLWDALVDRGWSPRVGDGFAAWDLAVHRGPRLVRIYGLTDNHFTADLHGRLTRVRVAAALPLPGLSGPVRRLIDGVAVARGLVRV